MPALETDEGQRHASDTVPADEVAATAMERMLRECGMYPEPRPGHPDAWTFTADSARRLRARVTIDGSTPSAPEWGPTQAAVGSSAMTSAATMATRAGARGGMDTAQAYLTVTRPDDPGPSEG